MKLFFSRDWTTPLTIGVFALMAITGVLMFFHLNNKLQEDVHAWAGWVLLGGVVLHVVSNWLGFKRHFQSLGRAPAVGALAVVVLAASFALAPGGDQPPSVPGMAIKAIATAPLRQVAPLFGKTPDQARSELASAGIVLTDVDTSLSAVIGKDRDRLGLALRTLSGAAALQ